MKNDFADWLSPMLVKELRQGVRSRAFVTTFILLQAAMLLNVLTGLLNSETNSSEDSTAFFWVLVGASVLFILPLSGLNSVGGEIKANTLELIFLTRLTALRIITGKWLAVFAQAVLLVSAVLPYLVLRYFIGGINLTAELIALAAMLGASAVFSAVTIGISPYQTRAVRGFLVVAVVIVVWSSAAPFVFGVRYFGSGRVGMSLWLIVPAVACAAILLQLMLEMGASKIAPDAENHAAAKRLLAFVAWLVAAGASFLPGDSAVITRVAFLLAAAVCAAALCEQPRWIGSIYRPFARRGFFGRGLGRLLYPGWFSAFWFTTLIFAAFAALMARQHLLVSVPARVRLISDLGVLLFPVAITRLCFPKTGRPFVLFLVVQISCLAVALVCGMFDSVLSTGLANLSTFLPLSALIRSVSTDWTRWDWRAVAVSVTTAGSWLILLVSSFPSLRRVSELERITSQSPVPDASLA